MRFAVKLHRRIGLMIVALVLTTSGIFALAAVGLAYEIEDRLFARALDEEVSRQRKHWQETGALTAPQLGYIRIYRSQEELPADIQQQAMGESRRVEFRASLGRHYRVIRFQLVQGDVTSAAYAVADVSRYLVVGPSLDQLLRFLAILGAVVAAIMGFAGFLLARRSLKPLSLLAQDVTVAGPAVPTIIPANYPANEIGLLAARLSQAFERIRQFVSREQAFTRDASHELRTPIAVVRGAAEVLGLQKDLTPSSRDALRRIDAATKDMAEALDLLLALARERDVQEWEPTLLLPLVEKAVADTVARFPDHGLEIRIEIDPDFEVLVRPRLLQLVLNNLIGNSLQHADASELVIRLRERSLILADNGKGMRGAEDPFRPFAKAEGSQGSGLGLDIVRRLCAVDDIDLTYCQGRNSAGVEFALKFNREYVYLDMGNFIFKTA